MADFVPDLRGVTAEEVQRRRKLFAERLAGCPLERWLERHRQVDRKTAHSQGKAARFVQCACACHEVRPLTGIARERHERREAA